MATVVGLVLLLACSYLGAASAGVAPTCLSPNVDLSDAGPCGCKALTGANETHRNGPYNLCQACHERFNATKSDPLRHLTYKLCVQIVGEFKDSPAVLGAISDPVWGTNSNPNEERVARVLGALKCIYGLAKVPNAKFWACNNYNLRGDAYAATVVPPPRVGYIRAALNGDTTWYVASAINFFGQFRLTKSKSSALLVWFDPASPAFSIETLNAPYRDLSINSNLVPQDDNPKLDFQADKPAEGFIAGIQGNFNGNNILDSGTANYVFVGKAFSPIPTGGHSIRKRQNDGVAVQSFIWSYNPTSKALTAKWQNKDGSIVGVKFVQAWEKQEERFRPFLPDGVYYLSATAADDFQLFCKRYCRGENSATQSDCTPDICDPEEDTVPERDTGEVTLSFEANV